MKRPHVTVLSMEPKDGKFDVYYSGYRELWTIDQIKRHVAQGGGLSLEEV